VQRVRSNANLNETACIMKSLTAASKVENCQWRSCVETWPVSVREIAGPAEARTVRRVGVMGRTFLCARTHGPVLQVLLH